MYLRKKAISIMQRRRRRALGYGRTYQLACLKRKQAYLEYEAAIQIQKIVRGYSVRLHV